MKTNHQRGFRDKGSFRDPSMSVFETKLSDRAISTHIGNDFTNGHRGAAKSKAGAKKYLRTRARIDGKLVVKRELENVDE